MIRLSCPTCKTVLSARPEHAGAVIACPKCKTQIKVPSPVPAAAIQSPAPPPPIILAGPPPLVAEQAEWYYAQGGQQFGPLSWSHFRQLAASSQLGRTDMVWKNGMQAWAQASTVADLFPDNPSSGTCLIPGMHNQRSAIAIAAGVGMLATFLPWLNAPIIGSVYGAAGFVGWITLLLFIPAMVLALKGDKLHPLLDGARLRATIPAGIATLCGLFKIVELKIRMSEIPRDNPFAEGLAAAIQIGIGVYVLIAAGSALVVLAWVLVKPSLSRVNGPPPFSPNP